MACIDPDGFLTLTAKFLLKSLSKGPLTPEEIAKSLGEPLFKTRGNLREMAQEGYIEEKDGQFFLTDKGRENLD